MASASSRRRPARTSSTSRSFRRSLADDGPLGAIQAASSCRRARAAARRPRHVGLAGPVARPPSSCSWPWWGSSSSSPARTSPTCCSPARPPASGRWRCASPWGPAAARLVRQFLVESVVLCSWGRARAAGGRLDASRCSRAQPGTARARVLSPEPDLRVALLHAAVSLLTGVCSAWRRPFSPRRPDLPHAEGRVGRVLGRLAPLPLPQGPGGRPGRALAAAAGRAGPVHAEPHEPADLDPGFKADNVVTFSVDPSLNGYDDPAGQLSRAAPRRAGGRSPACARCPWPRTACSPTATTLQHVTVDGYEAKEDENMNPNFNGVGPGFFRTLGIPLLRGRDFARPTRGRAEGRRGQRDASRATSTARKTPSAAASAAGGTTS